MKTSKDIQNGIWKSGKGKGRHTPKGRQLDDEAVSQLQQLLPTTDLRQDLLIEYLHLIQDKNGHLSAAHIRALAEFLKTSMAHIYEVASFYAHFDIVKEGETSPPEITIRVCDSLSCELDGAQQLLKALKDNYSDGTKVRVLRAPCMGRCDTAPTLEIGHNHIDQATPEKVAKAIKEKDFHPHLPNYETLQSYLNQGGYKQYESCLRGDKTPDEIQQMLIESGLRGLGGAGFPAGKKWSFVRAEKGPHYLAVNGDEGEPGTFKDRHYLEHRPHTILEGALITAWAINAEKIFLYIRDEYPAALAILKQEITALERAEIIPKRFIDLRRGAGAYICGEESAMIESIEGKRGLPRHRPPYVAQNGIFGRPTLVHNIETLHWISTLCYKGPEYFSSVEKNGRKGLRTYSVSGRVKNPGVKILAAGSTITDIIDECGGMLDGHTFMAYQPGGPSSGLLPANLNDIPLDFDTLQPYGSFIGSAAVVILSDRDSARSAALNILKFFEDESCGQCTPCRVGCQKAVQLMQEDKWDKDLLKELGETMQEASICGLGQAAPNAIYHVLKHFKDEV